MHFHRTLFIGIAFVAYLVCAAYLLLRAEGLSFNPHEIGLIETAIVSVGLTEDATVTLTGKDIVGRTASFSEITPGRHVVGIVTPDGRRASVVVHAEARRVTSLDGLHVPEVALIGGEVLNRAATTAALSEDGRRIATVRDDGSTSTLAIYSTLAPELDPVLTLPVAARIDEVAWLTGDRLALLSTSEIWIVTLPRGMVRVALPGTGASLFVVRGGTVLARLATGEVYAIADDGHAEPLFEHVTAVRRSGGELVLAQGPSFLTVEGTPTLPALPDGVSALGMLRRGSDVIAWDTSAQGWLLRAGEGWRPFLADLRGGHVRADGSLLLWNTGGILDGYGTILLQQSAPIDAVIEVASGRLLLRSGSVLADCSLVLRSCAQIADGVSQVWMTNGVLLVRQGTLLRMFRLS